MKKTNKKIQAAQPGAVIAPYAQAGNFLGTAVSGVSDEGGNGDFAGSILSGAASGAGFGSMFRPIGTGVGTLVGGLTGWFGAKKRKEQLQAMQDRRDYQNNYSVARANTSSAMANYYSSHDTAMTMKEGGIAGYSPVYVNDGETIMHPDGTVEYVPEKGRKTDSVLKWLPVGSHVYGGLTEPATGQKFQDIAHNMYKPTKKDSKGRYAEGSKQANIAIERLGKLFQVQQSVSEQKGVKPKMKDLKTPAAKNGLDVAATFAQATPMIHNWLQTRRDVDHDDVVVNPNADTIMKQYRNPVNIGKFMQDVNNSANTAYYNVNTMGNTTGAGMKQRVAIANNVRRGISDAYSKYNEMEATLGAQRAEALNSLGQQYVNAQILANENNAKNDAARRSFMSEFATQLGQLSGEYLRRKELRKQNNLLSDVLNKLNEKDQTP